MSVLREIANDGYPADYLAARVHGRRATLRRTEHGIRATQLVDAASDAAIWDALITEFDWLRRQMHPGLRATFAPVFTLFGIKTLVLALRDKAAERQASVERLMDHELFAEDLRLGIVRAPDVAASVAALAGALTPMPGNDGELTDAYAAGGLKGLETRLMRDFLGQVATARLHPAIRRFFAAFIDLRNLVTLYKQLRWNFQDTAAYVPGGSLATSRLVEASASGDGARLDALVREVTGERSLAPAAGEAALESRLLSHLTHELRKASPDGDVELLLDYLWSVYVDARNRALRMHTGSTGAAVLEQELIA